MDVSNLVNSNLAVKDSKTQLKVDLNQVNVNDSSALTVNTPPVQNSQNNKSSTNTNNINKNGVKSLVQKLNDSISTLNDSVKFSYSEDAKALIVKVVDTKTGQVIRQIPPEELVKLEASLSQSIGIIFNKEVK